MNQMTWEQKLAALQALGCDTSLRMRKPGDWYVSAVGRGIGGDGMSRGNYGNGKTPQEAVEDDWRQIVEMIPSDRYVIARTSMGEKRARWNGFMWAEVPT